MPGRNAGIIAKQPIGRTDSTMINGNVTVDGHAHTFSSEEVALKVIQSFNRIYHINFENSGTGCVDNLLDSMRENGIDYTVTANFAPPGILHHNNLWTIDASKRHDNLVPLVSFHPDMEGHLRSFLECYMSEGAKGIKLHPMAQGFDPSNKRLKDIYEYCNDTEFPIVFHCGRVSNARLNEYSDLDRLLPVIRKYPDIPFILTHMADGNVNDVLSVSRSYGNVYFDTSIIVTGYPPLLKVNEPSWPDDDMVLEVINDVGADRIVFGSDYPWGSPGHDLNRFMKMKLDQRQKALILGGNAARIFGIDCKPRNKSMHK